jgi:hypothetical protein
MSKLSLHAADVTKFSYHTLRTISSPDDTKSNRKVYCGHAPARSFLPLPDDENVRTYLVDAEGKKRKRLTDVHREIRDTLRNRPEDFPTLNSGIVIVARGAEVDDKNNVIELRGASIINGSQTRGELENYLQHCKTSEIVAHDVHVKFEIIVTDDDDLIAEISIARNFQNDVARISIAGRRQQLEELEAALQVEIPDIKLRKKETDRADDFYDTEKLIQVITALVPTDLWFNTKEAIDPRKSYTYSGKSKCLKEFQDIHKAAKDPNIANADQQKRYQFFIDMAPTAYRLYGKWIAHQGFNGSRLRSIERDKDGNTTRVPDGMVFPMIAALSAFMKKENGKWIYSPPKSFTDGDLIQAAISQYKETAGSNPGTMGKTHSVYSSLFQLTSIFKRLDPS